MARLLERILIWVAIVVTAAALLAVGVYFLPNIKLPAVLSRPMYWLRAHQPGGEGRPAIDRAEDLLASGDGNAALAAAKQAVDENSADPEVDNRAGNVALRAGDEKDAEHYYLLGESADRSYAWNFIALGQVYERRGDSERADAQLRAATVAAPAMAFVHYDLGVVELEEHLYAAALADFQAELTHSPTYKPAMIGRAEALDKLGRRGEALALYRRAGVTAGHRAQPPKLVVRPLVQPSPSPTAVALVSPTPTATPKPAHMVARRRPKRHPSALLAINAQPTLEPTPTPAAPPWAVAGPYRRPSGGGNGSPGNPKQLTAVIADARSYVSGVSEDLSFTRALPASDPTQSTVTLQNKLNAQLSRHNFDIEGALKTGTAALLSGRLELAAAAFGEVADAAPRDWRGSYLAGLTAQAQGDSGSARRWFAETAAREARPEPYTSLAILDINDGNLSSAQANARRAAAIDPTYEPGRFVAGMIDLMQTDVREAERNLEAALALGGAPSRTEYFINALQQSVGETSLPGG